MQIIQLTNLNQQVVLQVAQKVLAARGLMIFPTETTYGIGVIATSEAAVKRLLTYKSRREGKPLSIAVADQAMAERFVILNEQARVLYKQLLPGPVTVISQAKLGMLAPGVVSEFGTLGVRIPDYPFVLELVKLLGKPITATSANGSGKPRPYSVAALLSNLTVKQRSLIDLVLDAGTLPTNPPSTVIDTTLSTPVTLRQGAIVVDGSDTRTILRSNSLEETKRIAGKLCLQHWDAVAKSGLVFALDGPLGAGKTVFAQGVAEFLGVRERLTSPTYSYMQEYPFARHQTTGTLYHCDFWKIDAQATFERLELASVLGSSKVVVIEWFAQVQEYLQPLLAGYTSRLVHVQIGETPTGRTLTLA